MIWFLGFAGLGLALLGLWGGPAVKSKRREAEALARKQPTVSDAWDVLARPLEEELIKIPEHRPWYAPGGDKRFQRGVLVGLGGGLLVAALAVSLVPRELAPQQIAAKDPAPATPAPTQQQTPTPAGTPAPAPAPAKQEPPKPVNVNFVVAEGDTADVIADKLKTAGLIADTEQFLKRLASLELDTKLKAGTFVIPTGASIDKVIEVLTA